VTRSTWTGTIVVPVKSTRRGKSRLALPDGRRRELATAFAIDTVTAAGAVAAVLVVAEDRADADVLDGLAEVHLTLTADLNSAIRDGLDRLDPAAPAAVMPADLPGLLPAHLSDALRAAAGLPYAAVADRDGIGTTLLVGSRADRIRPRFGGPSFAAHTGDGAVALDVPLDSSLRRDVDRPDDLVDATGERSAAVLRSWRNLPSTG
jgi:2-phospho-L-lactate/phosphoenolpyruvate guanylyltransferase